MNRLQLAVEQIALVRRYSAELIDQIDPATWFEMPGGVTHVAWQVGHLAIAEYFLALDRTRGSRPEDERLIPKSFRAPFIRLSTPVEDTSRYPRADEIRGVFDRVHDQVIREVPQLDDGSLDERVDRVHRLLTTKFSALMWCPQHEMSHVGQIGLLRRMLGGSPMW